MSVITDLRYAWRAVRRDWRFSAVLIATLATGIAASGAIFNIVNASLLRPLPIPDESRVYRLRDYTENPGGQRWGNNCLLDAPREGRVHTFAHDISGLKRVEIVLRNGTGEARQAMTDRGFYPCQTGAARTATYYTFELPVGLGDVRYFIEAEDSHGNIARSALERVYLA